MKRRFITLTLSLLLMALCRTWALAATEGGYTYSVAGEEATITRFDHNKVGEDGNLTIADKLGGYPVTKIEEEAFYNCTKLKSVTIPDSVTVIGKDAFEKCSSLTSVTLPNKLTRIETGVFQDCSSLTSITIPNGVTIIRFMAFSNCSSLTSITIPGSVTEISYAAFSKCPSMEIWYGGTEAGWNALGDNKPGGTLHAIAAAGEGTAEQPYTVTRADHWDTLAGFVADDTLDTAGKHFRLNESISVSTMLGALGHPFSGIFDGDGKTLSVTISGTDRHAAPFQSISGAAIKNLKVAGTVSGGIHSAGLVGGVSGSGTNGNLIENCEVAVSVTTSGSYCGGILGHGGKAVTTLRGCVFSGSLLGSDLIAGTLWGWSDAGAKAVVEACLDASSCSYPIGRINGAFAAGSSVTNIYYLAANKTSAPEAPWSGAGKRAYTVSAGEGVTVGLRGAPGLFWENRVFAAPAENIGLTLTGGDEIEGTQLDYAASAGTLTAGSGGYTLTMPETNVVIAARNMVFGVPYTGGSADCALVPANGSTWVPGWYVVREDTSVQDRINLYGTVNLILPDGKTLTAAKGIHVPEGCSLTIWAQWKGTGALKITGPDESNAGIGGNKGERCGTVAINGGVIRAQGGRYGAGIGGGDEGAGGTVWIHGGEVTAAGLDGSAGIGGGDYAGGGSVTVTGGKVTATGSVRSNTSQASAGIGAGRPRAKDADYVPLNGGSCTIAGGIVIAVSGSSDPEKGAQAIGASFKDVKTDANNAGALSVECDYLVIADGSGNALPVPPGERMTACRGRYARIQACGHSYRKNDANTYVCEWCGSETDHLPAFGDADFTLPGGLTKIGDYAFLCIALGIVEIPGTCESIGKGAFRNSTLRQIRIPSGCSVAENAFEGCIGTVVFGSSDAAKVSAAHGSCMFVEDGQ